MKKYTPAIILVLLLTAVLTMSAAYAPKPTQWDTSALDLWRKGEDSGTVRMVGAWEYSRHDDAVTLEDEQGNLWEVDAGSGVQEEDFLLLWLADNHTPNDPTDDLIIKMWREVH